MPKISREKDRKVLIFTPDVDRETVISAKLAAAFTYFMAINLILSLSLVIYFLAATNLGVVATRRRFFLDKEYPEDGKCLGEIDEDNKDISNCPVVGSLKLLKDLNELQELKISNTNLSEGLECLPETATTDPLLGGILAATSPVIEVNNYNELLGILAPIEIKELLGGEVSQVTKELIEKTKEFLKIYDEDENEEISLEELISERNKLTQDLNKERKQLTDEELELLDKEINKLEKDLSETEKEINHIQEKLTRTNFLLLENQVKSLKNINLINKISQEEEFIDSKEEVKDDIQPEDEDEIKEEFQQFEEHQTIDLDKYLEEKDNEQEETIQEAQIEQPPK
ncbi:12949_t:CDS:2 [Ambispora gerdemannii]|uniref:12949_t:CDS:1 n=1 Tax=Ambispora gerdemannii TaxID=144530 RepID=A0A9N8YZ27_9GLOM|nr:12949_t:CDS:2 [Ambispora gerdemannii]